jgi:hypothetical protein
VGELMGKPYARRILDGNLPRGAIYNPVPGGSMDNLLDGLADNYDADIDKLEALKSVRDPWKVDEELLPDLEREYGISPNSALTISDRRANLAIARYKRKGLSTLTKLQSALDRAGFGYGGYGLIVTQNESPAIDPAIIVKTCYQTTAHAASDKSNAFAGNSAAYAGVRSGYYLVNGDNYTAVPVYPQAGIVCARAFTGSDSLSGQQCAGHYNSYADYSDDYDSPPAGYWPLVFFVGGYVSRNSDGSIASIQAVKIPAARRQELNRLVLRIKPLGMWAGMIIQLV